MIRPRTLLAAVASAKARAGVDLDRTGHRSWDRWAWAVLLLGVAIRLEAYLARRPLYTDESALALNIASSGGLALAEPLALEQVAPVPFLWAVKGAVLAGGVNELALRIVPLLAGLGLLFLVWLAARRMAGPAEALFAALLAALSFLLLYYSTDLKPYSTDALATAVVVLQVDHVLRRPEERRRWRLLLIGGVIALLCSVPSVLVLAGALVALVLDPGVRGTPTWIPAVALLVLSWIVIFTLLVVTTYGPAAANPYLYRFWEGTYLRLDAPDLGRRLARAGSAMFIRPFPAVPFSVPAGLAAALFGLGAVGLWWRAGRSRAALVVVPFGAVVAASALGKYPVAERLFVFLAPLACLALSGLVSLTRSFGSGTWRTFAPALMCAGAIGLAAVPFGHFYLDPRPEWNLRSLVGSVPASGEPVYVFAEGLTQWVFYTTTWRAPDRARLQWIFREGKAGGAVFPNAPSRGGAVVCEGDALVLEHGGRREIIGIPTGTEFRLPTGHTRELPDPGWADNEVRRMRVEADTTVWIFAAQFLDRWLDDLLDGVRRQDGVIIEARRQDKALRTVPVGNGYFERAALFHVAFPRTALPLPFCPPHPAGGGGVR